MLVSRPNAQEPTPEEIRQLDKLKIRIDRAAADGKISKQEMELYRKLVTDKIVTGELEYEF